MKGSKKILVILIIIILFSAILSCFENQSSTNAASVDTGGNLEAKRKEAQSVAISTFSWASTSLTKWNGTPTATTNGAWTNVPDSKNATYGSPYNSSTNTYTCDTPAKFAYALGNIYYHPNATINITSDLDMDGKTFYSYNTFQNAIIEGNNHTIYNFYIYTATLRNCGIGAFTDNITLQNITFKNMKIDGSKTIASGTQAGGIGLLGENKNNTDYQISNVHFEDCLVIAPTSGDNTNKGVGLLYGYSDGENSSILNSSAKKCSIIGLNHVGTLAGVTSGGKIQYSYVANCTVIGYGFHSGTFNSCTNREINYESCWSNGTIYANQDVGGFTCAGTGVMKRCYSSGIVEGENNIGGFVGYFGRAIIENSYTTCMVGMNYSGSNMGGFVGRTSGGGRIQNCYAAGEVGSIDTDIEGNANIGGFIGYDGGGSWINCYYDMQTTAMKNRVIGNNYSNDVKLANMIRTKDGVKTEEYNGITGVTTNMLTKLEISSHYVLVDGLYPQLSRFANNSSTLQKAYSAASASTVFLDEWKDVSNPTFDTVRSIMRNVAFSSNKQFLNNPDFNKAYVSDRAIESITWKTRRKCIQYRSNYSNNIFIRKYTIL